jgi:predicted RNA-binding protein with TRAM domain
MSEGAPPADDGSSGQRQRFPKVYFKPKPVKIGDEIDVTIAEVSKKGDGVTRIDG